MAPKGISDPILCKIKYLGGDIVEDRLWTVYVHINKVNQKAYVGITSKKNPNHRWSNGRGYWENPFFFAAINKYGWDGFDHIVIRNDLSEQEAKQMEKDLIKCWRTQDREFGYNMTSGGDGTPNYHPSEETRKKLSEARRRENLSEETLRRRSEGLRGRKFSEEHKKRISQSLSRPIYMFTKDGDFIREFPSARVAEIELGINHSHISQCCTGKRMTTGGYKWSFAQ